MKAAEWIDRLKAARGWESDYRVAKEIGVGRATVSKYRSGGGTFDEETALRVADALGEHPAVLLLDQAAERARTEEARDAIASALERIRGKLRAGGAPRLVAAGGKARVDISSVTFAGGKPEELHRNTHRIEQDQDEIERQRATAEAALLQLLANRFAAQSSYNPAFSRA